MEALNSIDQNFEQTLRALLPQDRFRMADPKYLEEPRGRYFAPSSLLALPRNTQEVSMIVKACNKARVGIVPYGGGTGLVGGQLMDQGPRPLILSLEKMNGLRRAHPSENALIVEAGMILADVQEHARQCDRLFPLSLAAEGSAQIGGNLATNAGGTSVLRYGNARDLCLGIEAVMASGEIYHGLQRLRKNNMGYDLRHLLIGSEGTLGIITAAALKLFPIPSNKSTAIFVVQSPRAALSLLAMAQNQLGEMISAFELMHEQGYGFIQETLPHIRRPFDKAPEWSVLIELGLPKAMDPNQALEDLFVNAMEAGLVHDGIIAQSERESDDFWALREHFPVANKMIGAISSHDISVPLEELDAFIKQANAAMKAIGDFRINCFGHVGDGNLHYNIFPPQGESANTFSKQREQIKRTVHDIVVALGGSVSAEHGVGRMKTADLERYSDPAHYQSMRAIKTALDPQGILNPGAVINLSCFFSEC